MIVVLTLLDVAINITWSKMDQIQCMYATSAHKVSLVMIVM